MDIKCYELLGELKALMLDRKGDLSFYKHLVLNKNLIEDSIEMMFLKGVRWFYIKDKDKIYRIVSLNKTSAGCVEYKQRYSTHQKIELNEDILIQILAKQNIIIPELWSREADEKILFFEFRKR